MDIDLTNIKEFDKILTKKFGNNYTGFGKKDSFEKVKRVPLECISINNALGGGLPVGRLIEVYGGTSIGKSLLSNHFIKSYQQQGKLCMLIDVEQTADPEFISMCGVDLDKLCKVSPDTAEAALEAVRTGMNLRDSEGNPVLSLIVLDSIASLVPAADYDEKKEIGSTMIGSLARLMSTSLKQFVTLAAQSECTLIMINQIRQANLLSYGAKNSTTGGSAVKYYSSIRLNLTRVSWIEEGKDKIGQIVNIETEKNKTHTPFKNAKVNFMFPTMRDGQMFAGVDVLADIVNNAIDNNIIKQTATWFNWKEEKFQGIKNVYNYFITNQESYNKLYKQVNELHNPSLNNNDDSN